MPTLQLLLRVWETLVKKIFIIFATQKNMTFIQDFLLLDCYNTT